MHFEIIKKNSFSLSVCVYLEKISFKTHVQKSNFSKGC